MSWTYATLNQAIQDYCENNETSFVTNMPDFVTQAEDRILNSVQLPAFRKSVAGNMTLGNRFLSLPADYLAPYSVAIENSGSEFLILKDVPWIREVYPDKTATSTPKYYATFSDESFLIGPTPNASFDVEIHYFYRPESIVTAGTSWLGTNAESCLLYGCLVEAYTYMKGEQDIIGLYEARYREALEELKDLGEGFSQSDNYRGRELRENRR
tara:strand:- start:535 stop:1170 length:636 start_codon:yes stop_codon:yes gene_type:complete